MGSEVLWKNATEFSIDDLQFFMNFGNYTPDQGDATKFHILKDKLFFSIYEDVFRENDIRNMLEVGFFDGGSTLYFLKHFGVQKLLALDVRMKVAALEDAIDAQGLRERVSIGYGTSQGDREAIHSRLGFFEGQPLDLIVDDASHLFDLSKSCFETCFPLLREGGIYILEDWSWAHVSATQPGGEFFDVYKQYEALSSLLFAINILMASQPGSIEKITTYQNCAVIKRGSASLPQNFSLDTLALNRGRGFLFGAPEPSL